MATTGRTLEEGAGSRRLPLSASDLWTGYDERKWGYAGVTVGGSGRAGKKWRTMGSSQIDEDGSLVPDAGDRPSMGTVQNISTMTFASPREAVKYGIEHGFYSKRTFERAARARVGYGRHGLGRVGLRPSLRHQALCKTGICYLCLERLPIALGDIDIDHVIPVVLGGKDVIENLMPTHARCNRSKGGRPPTADELKRARSHS